MKIKLAASYSGLCERCVGAATVISHVDVPTHVKAFCGNAFKLSSKAKRVKVTQRSQIRNFRKKHFEFQILFLLFLNEIVFYQIFSSNESTSSVLIELINLKTGSSIPSCACCTKAGRTLASCLRRAPERTSRCSPSRTPTASRTWWCPGRRDACTWCGRSVRSSSPA